MKSTSAGTPAALQVIAAALAVAVLDGTFAVTVCKSFNSACTAQAAFRGIASYAPSWFPVSKTWGLGVLLHGGVACCWTAAYTLAYRRSGKLQGLTSGWGGVAAAAVAWGVMVWLVMDLVVLPLAGSGRHTPVSSPAFWVILAGHPLVVGLPIAALVRAPDRT